VFHNRAGFALAVEVKIRPQTGFSKRQLQKYDHALRAERYDHSGVLALTPQLPAKADLLGAMNRNNLGVILWKKVAPSLREIVPSEAIAASSWTQLMELIIG
jgi:hypothetical protein